MSQYGSWLLDVRIHLLILAGLVAFIIERAPEPLPEPDILDGGHVVFYPEITSPEAEPLQNSDELFKNDQLTRSHLDPSEHELNNSY